MGWLIFAFAAGWLSGVVTLGLALSAVNEADRKRAREAESLKRGGPGDW